LESKEVQAQIAQGVKVPTTIKAYNASHYNILGISKIIDDNNNIEIRTRLITKSVSDWQKMNDYKKSAPRLCNSKQAIILHDPTRKPIKAEDFTEEEIEEITAQPKKEGKIELVKFVTTGRLTDNKKEKVNTVVGLSNDLDEVAINNLATELNVSFEVLKIYIESL